MSATAPSPPLPIDGESLDLAALESVARAGRAVCLATTARDAVLASRRVVDEAVARGVVVYGVTTGFGNFADVHIPLDRLRELQLNLLRSHAAGVGAPLEEAQTRALMLLRTNVLAKGFSGVRLERTIGNNVIPASEKFSAKPATSGIQPNGSVDDRSVFFVQDEARAEPPVRVGNPQ